jgi:hypothetical protein
MVGLVFISRLSLGLYVQVGKPASIRGLKFRDPD